MFLFVFMGFLAVSAQRTITGKVTDSSGEPLSEVLISPTEGAGEAISDENGNYKIEVSDSTPSLVFEYVGEKQLEVPITGNVVNVVYAISDKIAKAEKTDQVVVTGYQKIDRKLFTGVGERLKAEDIVIAGVPDISRALQGQVAGVDVQNVSATFGAAPVINIRGRNSINGNNKPVWVIDGVIQEDLVNVSSDNLTSGNLQSILTSGVAGLNQDDIKDIQILRDVSATGYYGAQAMNGVIVITTKKGRSGKPTVNYTVSTTVREAPNVADYNILDAGSELDIYRDLYRRGYINTASYKDAQNYGAIGLMLNKIYNKELNWDPSVPETNWNEDYLKYYAVNNTDWFKELFGHSIATQHSLSIAGGGDRSSFRGSLGYYHDGGATPSNDVKNYTALFSANFDLSDKLKVGMKLSGNFRDQRVPGTRDREYDPIIGQFNRDFDINPFSFALNTSRLISPYESDGSLSFVRSNYAPFNILYELEHNYVDIGVKDVTSQLNAEYKWKKWLKSNHLIQARFADTKSEYKIHETANAAEAYRSDDTQGIRKGNRFLYVPLDSETGEGYSILEQGGFYNTIEDRLTNYFFRNAVEITPELGDNHQLIMMLANEMKFINRYHTENNGWGYLYDKGGLVVMHNDLIDYLNDIDQQLYKYTEYRDRYIGNIATAAYAYKGKYIANFTGRYDGSNQLGNVTSARWLPSWNVSLGWNIDKEAFMNRFPAVSTLKLKTTYGVTGSIGPNANAALTLYGIKTLRPIDNETGLEIRNLKNNNLTWEKLKELNLGFELGLWNNRIFTEFNYYHRQSDDLIDYVTTSGIGGISRKLGNVGQMKSDGFEVTLKTKNINTENFGWETQFTYNYHKSKITQLQPFSSIGEALNSSGAALLGYDQAAIYSIPFAGLDANGAPTFYDKDGNIVTDIDLQQRNDIALSLKYEGPVAPRHQGGLVNRFRYKNWNFSFNVIYKAGNKIRLSDVYKLNNYNPEFSDFNSFSKEILNRWQMYGDENITNVPAIPAYKMWQQDYEGLNAYSLYNNSDVRVAKGDFVRLKDISVSYTLPKEWLNNTSIQGLNFTFNVNNLWLIYSDKKLNGMDPEFFNSGGVALPTQRTYTFTLGINF